MSPAQSARRPVRAVVALKPLEQAKTRLGRPDAPALVAAMLADVLAVTSNTPEVDETVVVCGDTEVARLAVAGAARPLPDPGTGLNGAYLSALVPGSDTVIVQADLPALTVADLSFLIAAGRGADRLVLLADAAGTGTAVLWIPAGQRPELRFGADSRRAHASIGVDLTAEHQLTRGAAGVAARRDIDTEADLDWFAAHAPTALGAHTAGWLAVVSKIGQR